VNALIDFQTGKAQIEVPGDQAVHAKVARAWTTLQVGTRTVALAEADTLPKLGEMVDCLWRNCPAPTGKPPQAAATSAPALTVGQATSLPLSADSQAGSLRHD